MRLIMNKKLRFMDIAYFFIRYLLSVEVHGRFINRCNISKQMPCRKPAENCVQRFGSKHRPQEIFGFPAAIFNFLPRRGQIHSAKSTTAPLTSATAAAVSTPIGASAPAAAIAASTDIPVSTAAAPDIPDVRISILINMSSGSLSK